MELCIEHDIEEVEFVEHWMAYSVTNLNARIVSPSISQLNDMCKRISKKTSNIPSRKIDPKNEAIVQIYNRPDTNIADEVMDTYCMTPKVSATNFELHLQRFKNIRFIVIKLLKIILSANI